MTPIALNDLDTFTLRGLQWRATRAQPELPAFWTPVSQALTAELARRESVQAGTPKPFVMPVLTGKELGAAITFCAADLATAWAMQLVPAQRFFTLLLSQLHEMLVCDTSEELRGQRARVLPLIEALLCALATRRPNTAMVH